MTILLFIAVAIQLIGFYFGHQDRKLFKELEQKVERLEKEVSRKAGL